MAAEIVGKQPFYLCFDDFPLFSMHYDEATGRQTAKRWQVARSTLSHWKRTGHIPTYRVTDEPLDQADIVVEEKLIQLIESGWLKARPLARRISHPDKISALLTARRHPNDPRYHVHHLRLNEIRQLQRFLNELAEALDTLFFFADRAMDGQLYSDVTQAELRGLLRRSELDTVNVRSGRTSREVARFWAFMRGQPARREDIDVILDRLKALMYDLGCRNGPPSRFELATAGGQSETQNPQSQML